VFRSYLDHVTAMAMADMSVLDYAMMVRTTTSRPA
jgi:hypothetical protein